MAPFCTFASESYKASTNSSTCRQNHGCGASHMTQNEHSQTFQMQHTTDLALLIQPSRCGCLQHSSTSVMLICKKPFNKSKYVAETVTYWQDTGFRPSVLHKSRQSNYYIIVIPSLGGPKSLIYPMPVGMNIIHNLQAGIVQKWRPNGPH